MKYELNFCSPLEQFEITLPLLFNINGFQIGFFITNISIFFSISCFLICFSFFLSGITLSNYLTSVLSLIYSFVSNLSKINAKNPEFFIFYLFLFNLILVNNLIGMIPYSFTTTSSALITFFLSFGSFFGICLVGFDYLGFDFFRLFLPSGCPLRILKLLIFIETVSYLIRAFSLAIRLFANMVSGHSLLKILASFAWLLLSLKVILDVFFLLGWSIISFVSILETLIALLQAYVFTFLVSIYLNDSLHAH